MQNFAFYLLIFLNFFQLISATNPPCKFIRDEMDKFHNDFVAKFEQFEKKIEETRSKDKLIGHSFGHAMFKKEFPSKIVNMKNEVEKFLRGKTSSFEVIYNEINNLQLPEENMKALKELQKELEEDEEQNRHTPQNLQVASSRRPYRIYSIKDQLDLVNTLIALRESVHTFIEDVIIELHIRQPKQNIEALDHLMEEQKAQFYAFFKKMFEEKKYFHKIEEIIKSRKKSLQKFYDAPKPPITSKTLDLKEKRVMPRILLENGDKLERAFDEANPLLKKVKLNLPPKERENSLPPPIKELLEHYVKIKKLLDNAVDNLPNNIEKAAIFGQKQQEFANLHDFLSLNIACMEMFKLIRSVADLKFFENQQNKYLADINWLAAKFIEEKLAEMNATGPFLNMAMAKKKEELPKELALNGREMDPNKKAILIAQNMLFIAAQIGKIYNFEDAIDATYIDEPFESDKDARLHDMVLKKLPPKSIGQFFYRKYVEMIENGEHKLSDDLEKMNIGESSAKDEHGPGSSLTKIGGQEVKEKKVKKMEENEEVLDGLRNLFHNS